LNLPVLPDDWLKGAFIAVIAILILAFPRRVLESLRRWGRDETHPERSHAKAGRYKDVAEDMRRLVRTSLLLVPTDRAVSSKIGGDPFLPQGASWPNSTRPLSFLAQLDLAEVQAGATTEWLPQGGHLFLFFDRERQGAMDMIRVHYEATASPEPIPAPKGVWRRFPEQHVSFKPCRSAPSLDWLGLGAAELGLAEGELNALDQIGNTPPRDETQHRIGGYPDEIQPERLAIACEYLSRGLDEPAFGDFIPAELEAAAEDWRLLLQIDSDPALKMDWVDGGRLYIFVRAGDARGGDFTRTITLSHFY
jgi:uncharacterized protein YwqG